MAAAPRVLVVSDQFVQAQLLHIHRAVRHHALYPFCTVGLGAVNQTCF